MDQLAVPGPVYQHMLPSLKISLLRLIHKGFSCLVACWLLLMSAFLYSSLPVHAHQHEHHQAGDAHSVVCSWMCSATQALSTFQTHLNPPVTIPLIIELRQPGLPLLVVVTLSSSRAPPKTTT